MEAPDEQLMLAYRDGNAAAFETLYLRHRGRLFRFVLRSVKSRATAEELFQEIWMRVIEARERYAPQARFTTWLYTIAHHRMVDHWRRGGLSLVELDEQHDPPGDALDPARQIEAREAVARDKGCGVAGGLAGLAFRSSACGALSFFASSASVRDSGADGGGGVIDSASGC